MVDSLVVRQLLPTPAETVDLTQAYAVPPGRHVRANMVSSADGAATADGVSGGLSSAADKQVFGVLRGLCDVVLVGAATVRAEGYGPAKMSPERREARRSRGQRDVPPIAVVTGSLDLDPDTPFFTAAQVRPIVLTTAAAPADRRGAIADRAELVEVGDERVDVAAALDALHERGLDHVLCEGGPSLLGRIAAARRLDELCLTLGPVMTAGEAGRVVTGPALEPPVPLALAGLLEDDGFLFLRYRSPRPGTMSPSA